MSNIVKYNGYVGSIEISIDDNCLHGKILFINDLVTYEALTPNELELEFQAAVTDYLESCHELNKEPDKPFSGSFNVRVGEELHRKAAIESKIQDTTLNDFTKSALEEKLSSSNHIHHHVHNNYVSEPSKFSSPEGKVEWTINENASSQH